MAYLIGISLIVLGMKIWTFGLIKSNRQHLSRPQYYSLFFALAIAYIQSLLELYGFYMAGVYGTLNSDVGFIKTYHLTIVSLSLTITLIVRSLYSQRIQLSVVIRSIVLVAFAAFLYLTDGVISGVELIGYSFSRIPGDYYWIFKAVFVVSMLDALVQAMKFRKTSNRLSRKGAKILTLSIGAYVLVALSVVALMNLGVAINGSGVASITFAILLFNLSLVVPETSVMDNTIVVRGLQPEFVSTFGSTIKQGYAGEGEYDIQIPGLENEQEKNSTCMEKLGWNKRIITRELPDGRWVAEEKERPWKEIKL